jgi:hypothetical protein
VRPLAIAAGVALAFLGIAGFIPAWRPEGLLFGAFAVDAARNALHFATGIFGIGMGFAGPAQAESYFRIVGVVYAVLAAAGIFTVNAGELMGMAHNEADLLLQAGLASFALVMGFSGGAATVRGGKGLRAL